MSKRNKWLLGAGIGVVAIVAAIGGIYYVYLRDDAPPEVSIAGALDSLEGESPSPEATAATTSPAATGTSTAGATAGPTDDTASEASGLDGTWTVDSTVDSFVGYRVVEELANFGVTTAVGRTPAVTGEVTIEANTVTAAGFEADMTQLASDREMRDGQLRRQGIQTDTYPTSTFTLTQPIELPETVAEGEVFTATLVGDLTLHGVTKAVEIPAEATLSDGYLVVIGSIDILFADYGIQEPTSMSVVSIEDHGIMEIQLFLKQS